MELLTKKGEAMTKRTGRISDEYGQYWEEKDGLDCQPVGWNAYTGKWEAMPYVQISLFVKTKTTIW